MKNIFHLTGAAHHIHQESKYWKTHQNNQTWNISNWNDGAHKTASASKNQNVILLSKKKLREWKNHGASKWSSEIVTKKWIILEARRNPKAWSSKSQSVRVVSRTKSEATEKSYSFILGRHNITFMKNQSTVKHITFTGLGINQSRKLRTRYNISFQKQKR